MASVPDDGSARDRGNIGSPRRRYQTGVVLIAYLAFLVLLLEGLPRIVLSDPRRVHLQGCERCGPSAWRLSWIYRHRSTGTDVYYGFDQYDPTKGWFSRPNLRGVLVFGDKRLNTNSQGFRGTSEYRAEKTAGRRRLLILGDSFTFGDEVSDDETYPYFLQRMLPQMEIMNLGVHGYGHDQMLTLLREQGPRLKPDAVLLGYVAEDARRNLLEFRDFVKPMYKLRHGQLVLVTSSSLPTPAMVLDQEWTRSKLLDMVSILYHILVNRGDRLDRQSEQITAGILGEMAETIREIGAEFMIAYLPSPAEVVAGKTKANAGEQFLLSWCRSNHVTCFSVPGLANVAAQGLDLELRQHWPPPGNRAIAEGIFQHLTENPG